jgi:hypothetical protein
MLNANALVFKPYECSLTEEEYEFLEEELLYTEEENEFLE